MRHASRRALPGLHYQNLHIVAVMARAKKDLSEGKVYFYDLEFRGVQTPIIASLAEADQGRFTSSFKSARTSNGTDSSFGMGSAAGEMHYPIRSLGMSLHQNNSTERLFRPVPTIQPREDKTDTIRICERSVYA